MYKIPNRNLDLNAQANFVHGSQLYTASAVFSVPEDVYAVWVTLIAGGGGGRGSTGNGGSGGSTTFGPLLTATGGTGGTTGGGNVSGGTPRGQQGVCFDIANPISKGGASVFGAGGMSTGGSATQDPTNWGAGGYGDAVSNGKGGGSGGWHYRVCVTVVPGQVIDITIGAAGSAGSGGGSTAGTAGFALVEW